MRRDFDIPQGEAKGEIAAWAEFYVVRARGGGFFGRRLELLIRQPDGSESWIAAGDVMRLNLRVTVR